MDAAIKAVLGGSADSIKHSSTETWNSLDYAKKTDSLEELLMELIQGLCLVRKKKSWRNTSFKPTRWAMETQGARSK